MLQVIVVVVVVVVGSYRNADKRWCSRHEKLGPATREVVVALIKTAMERAAQPSCDPWNMRRDELLCEAGATLKRDFEAGSRRGRECWLEEQRRGRKAGELEADRSRLKFCQGASPVLAAAGLGAGPKKNSVRQPAR